MISAVSCCQIFSYFFFSADPVLIARLRDEDIVLVAAGSLHTLALTRRCQVFCYANEYLFMHCTVVIEWYALTNVLMSTKQKGSWNNCGLEKFKSLINGRVWKKRAIPCHNY